MKVGLIGFGHMGSVHGRLLVKHPGVELVAVADAVEELRAQAAQELNVKTYASGDELIAADKYDVIFVCCPTYLHAKYTLMAMEAGCHVFCEKPMALNVDECTAMIDAQNKYGKMLMIGQVLRFWPEYVFLKKAIDNKTYGELRALSMTRVGGVSTGWQNWFLDERRGGVQMFDRHIHDTDAILWMLGTPKAICSQGFYEDPNTAGGFSHNFTQYFYNKPIIVNAEGSADLPQGHPFTAAYRAVFDRGVVEYDCTRQGDTLRVYDGGDAPKLPELPIPEEDASGKLNITTRLPYFYEQEYFFKCIREGVKPTTVTPEAARETIRVVRTEIESARSCKQINL